MDGERGHGDAMKDTIVIRKPTAPPAAQVSAPSFTVGRPLAGLRVGIRKDRAWRSWQLISDLWAERLRRDGAAEVVSVETLSQVGEVGAADRQHVHDLADATDFAIVGLGTCGSCTSFAIADAVLVERHAKPVIAIVAEEFATHGRRMAAHLGHGELKVLVLPYPLEARAEHELRDIADQYYPQALALLGVTR
jgi:hypothetical protein